MLLAIITQKKEPRGFINFTSTHSSLIAKSCVALGTPTLYDHPAVNIDSLRKIYAECENIVISILDLIIYTWKLNSNDGNKDLLKCFYNKFQRLDFEYGHLEYLHPFTYNIIENSNIKDINDVKEMISGIILKGIFPGYPQICRLFTTIA